MSVLTALPAIAQDQEGPRHEDPDELHLFDEDEERTKLGWSRFYAAVDATYADADGGFDVKLPNGDRLNIIDFDRV